MNRIKLHCLIAAAGVLTAGDFGASVARAQGKTYPSYFGLTPSASYYQMHNEYDRDTYMNPNPFPSYRAGYVPQPYEEPAYGPIYPSNGAGPLYNGPYRPRMAAEPAPAGSMYTSSAYLPPPTDAPGYPGSAYPPNVYAPPRPAAAGFHKYDASYPTLGYYYGPGPFVYGHSERAGRTGFRYGWW